METSTLEEILDNHLLENKEISFLSIDVEGLDLLVLKSNNYSKYHPKVILVEVIGSSFSDIENSEILRFLKKKNYSIFAKTLNTVIFVSDKYYKEIYK